MRLVKNEPKVVEVSLSKRNLLYLLAQAMLSGEAATSTLDEPSGYLVKVSYSAEPSRPYTVLPEPLQSTINRLEAVFDE